MLVDLWLKEPIDEETGKPKLDKRNPDKSKRTVPTLGLVNLHGFTYDPKDKEWKLDLFMIRKMGKSMTVEPN